MILCKPYAHYMKQTEISHLSMSFLWKHHGREFVCAEISVQHFLPYLNQLQYIYVLYKV